MSISEHTHLNLETSLPAILVADAIVSEAQIAHAIAATRGSAATWIECLLLSGDLDDVVLARCAGAHAAVPSCPLDRLIAVPPDVKALIPADLAIEYRVVPVAVEPDGDLSVAMVDPTDMRAAVELEFFTGRRILREVARATAIAWGLHTHYGHDSALWRGFEIAA